MLDNLDVYKRQLLGTTGFLVSIEIFTYPRKKYIKYLQGIDVVKFHLMLFIQFLEIFGILYRMFSCKRMNTIKTILIKKTNNFVIESQEAALNICT